MEKAWTHTEISSANYCGMRWYLEYVEKVPRKRFSFFEKGIVFHDLIENFWDRKGDKYSDAEGFADYAEGKWRQHLIKIQQAEEGRRSSPVIWRWDGEKWAIAYQIKRAAVPLFKKLSEDGPPLFSETSFDFILDGIRYGGRIDEIRLNENGRPVIRDYKSGSPFMGEMRRRYDPQHTLYALALSAMAHSSSDFAKTVGLEDEAAELLGKNKVLSENITSEFVMLEDGEEDEATITTHSSKRTDQNYSELVDMITNRKRSLELNIIYPERGYKCDRCTVKEECDARTRENMRKRPGVQQFLNFAEPPYFIPKVSVMQKKKRGKKIKDAEGQRMLGYEYGLAKKRKERKSKGEEN